MPNPNFGNIQYKASNGLIKLDELEGIVECFVSGIGNKDSVGDICATGAFAKSLQRRKPRVVWGHNWNDPIGKVLEIYEVPASDPRLPMKMKMAGIGGLYAKVQFNLQSEKGKEAFANVAFFGEEQEWSIGYKTLRAQFDENLQANVLYEVELYEVSPVLHGANQLTGTISVKSDEEKMHGMMPMVMGAPTSPEPRRDGIFDEGVSQRISGPQLAGIVAELSRRAAGPVMVVEATENSVVFVKPGKGKFRIGYHFTGSEYMFGKPELIHAEQPKPVIQSGPSPMPGIAGKPSTNNPAMAMPVAIKPGNGGMVMVPLAPVRYEGSEKNKEPKLGAEEGELAESLVRIARKYGKFDEDGDGIWAGYYPPAENKVKDIGVKCSNCVLYLGEGKCKILDLKVEDEGKCRFAIIPDGVVVGFGKKEYSDILDDEEIKMIEDVESKYPGEFILGAFRNTVKKRRKKRKSYKTLEEWGVEELELEEKGLDPFLAHEYSYVIPVNPEDAFYFKSIIDPVLDYHRIDTAVNEYGIVINSPLSQESKDAISTATASAYNFLKKKIASDYVEEKALGRRIAGRAIDRPSIGGKKRRGGRGMGIPSGDLDPRTRRDSNLDGTLFDNVPGWEQPDPTPGGPGSIDNPKPSKRQLTDAKKPDGKEKLSSGAKNSRRHADRSADMEKQFPNAEENQKRIDHDAIAKAWEDQGLGWEEVPRYNADKNLSSDYLRGREIGVNQARVMWDGDSVKKRPAKFNEKAKASQDYSNWYSSYAKSVSAYLDAHSRDDSDNWDGIESALRADVKSKYPDTQDWAKEDIATLNEYLNDIGLLDGVQKPAPKKSRDSLSSGGKKPEAPKRTTGKLSSGDKDKPTREERDEALRLRRAKKYEDAKNEGDGKESGLLWDENGNYKERVDPDYGSDEDFGDDSDGLTPKERAEERAADAAYLEFSKITPEEMAARKKRGEAAWERLNSPEYLEESRLKRVARNKGKETVAYNADGTLKESPTRLSSGNRLSEAERLAAWKPVLGDLRRLKSRVNDGQINDGPIIGRKRAYMDLMNELDEIIANAQEERNLDLEGPTDKSRARFERLVDAGDWAQAGFHMEGEIASVREKAPKPVDDGRLSSGKAEWTKTGDGFEMDAPDIDGMYRINSEGKGKYSVTRFTDIYRNGGQNAIDEDIDRTFSSPSAAKKWAERDYDKVIENMSGADEYMPDSSRLSSGRDKLSMGRGPYSSRGEYDPNLDPYFDGDDEPDYEATNDDEWDNIPEEVRNEIISDIKEYVAKRDKSAADNVAREIDEDGKLGIGDDSFILEQDGVEYIASPVANKKDRFSQLVESGERQGDYRSKPSVSKEKLLESINDWAARPDEAYEIEALTRKEADLINEEIAKIKSVIENPSDDPMADLDDSQKKIRGIIKGAYDRENANRTSDNDMDAAARWNMLNYVESGNNYEELRSLKDTYRKGEWKGKVSKDGKYEVTEIEEFTKDIINGELEYEVESDGESSRTVVSNPAYTWWGDFTKFSSGADDDGLEDAAYDREKERELTGFLTDFGSSENEAERVLGNWYDNDPRQDQYLAEYKEDGDDFGTNFARAATAMYQDDQETLYDNSQSRNLSSGRKINKEQQIISDREIFERRMGGETLAETGAALGMKRQEVRQAELRHISRQRGAQQQLDLFDIETYREDQARMAAEEAAELSFNEAVYERRMGGESLAETAKALGMTREQVRRIEQTHLQLLRDRDKEANYWISRQGGDTLGSGKKKYVSPIQDMNPGQRLSSGKLDEVYRSVQEQLIEQIQKAETEGGKWEFPWHRDASLPRNAMNNNRPYSGINSLMLMFKKDAMGYETGMWAGFNQWKEKGGTVRKGEKGTMIIIPTIIPGKKDAEGNEVKAGSVFFKTGHVFNLDQIDGIDKEQFKMPQLSEEERVDELEKALSEVGAIVNHGGDRAFYRPSTDEITLPPFSSFKSKEAYYAVFAHELMHWTGHKDRLNRDHLGDFGSPEYAQEELVAEIASAFFMTAHGLTPEPREDHAQYLASWLKKLKSDPDALKNAFEQAQKAHDFAISKSPSMSKKLGKRVAEAGVVPGNSDSSYGGISPSLSSGERDSYVRNIDGSARTLAEELGMPDNEILDRFTMRKPYRDGDRNWYEAPAYLGNGVNQWNMGQDDSGEWFAELMFMDGVGENDEIDWDVSGVSSDGFKSPADLAQWTKDYEEVRLEWQRKFKKETDIEKIDQMLNEEMARRDAEYADSLKISRARENRQEFARTIAAIDESRLDWSSEDWADEAADLRMELSRENDRFSSGVRSRYDDTPVEEIGIVTNALKRTDEAGSNSRYIASRLASVPADKYDFDSIRRNGESVSFTYGGKQRTIYPTGMMAKKGGGIYVVGLDDEAGQYRSFSLHKIEGLVDGADAPYNPTQIGVPRGFPSSSAKRTRSVTSDRLSSGKVRPLDEVRTEIEDDARYESMVVQNAFGGTLGKKNRGGSVQRIALEDHQESINSLDRLVTLRNDLIRSLLDGKKVPADAYIFQIDQYADVSDEDFDLLTEIDDAIDAIHDQLSWREEQFSGLNDEVDGMKESISRLENAFRTSEGTRYRIRGPVNFESAMEKHIDDADGDAAEALYYMKNDAESIIDALDEIDNAEDRFSRVTHDEQIDEIKELIDSIDGGDVTPEDFASKLSDLFYKNVNGLEGELSELLDTQTEFENNGVTTDREDITGKPKDIFSSSNLSNFDMAEGNASDFLEPGDAPGLSSGRKKRTQGSKRRPMSDEDRQAFADGVRQRAATIPGKKKPAPSKDEFDAGSLGSGRFRFPDSTKRRRIGEQISAATSIKVGKLSENNDRSPDGKWMLDASKLNLILKDENGEILDTTEIAALMGISKAEAEKFNAPGAAISEADANTLVDRMFFNSSDFTAADSAIEAIWGFDSKPYWYDSRRGSQLSREEYADYMDEGIAMYGILSPEGFEETEQFVARETARGGFQLSTLADALGAKSGAEIAEALTFEVDGEKITPTEVQIKKWKRSGIPTGIIEQLVESGVIPNAGDIFGEDGVEFDNSIKQFDLWKKVSDTIAKNGKKVTGSELDDIIGATKVQTRLRSFEKDGGVKFSKNVGKALRYNDDEVKEIVDKLNKKFGLNETVESIKGGSSMSSGRRAARRISNTGNQATESLSSGRKNNGAPENITPRMQNELIGWAENARWSGFAQSVFSQFKAKGFLTPAQWTRLLQLSDNSRKQR
jgi:HK97 family phage prohead protease